jgi:hypothetical protein
MCYSAGGSKEQVMGGGEGTEQVNRAKASGGGVGAGSCEQQ